VLTAIKAEIGLYLTRLLPLLINPWHFVQLLRVISGNLW